MNGASKVLKYDVFWPNLDLFLDLFFDLFKTLLGVSEKTLTTPKNIENGLYPSKNTKMVYTPP